ncbi:hypothetical protein SOL28_06030 [Klebsiella aerogenes]|uniref:Uncharacterized protein n=1 Tax=Klebsiella aerogenes TaxID=548 RepID=A0AAW9LKS8_KLEAE|nr:hypothetical protein [Klebsiella aerogenes]MCD0205844.1 hypothetical protein [Klebsiella aerogenes]MDY0877645.1 hypothetical protein [Klebsiella aerogenes]MEA8798713.1 hypothetical protein [Klebsiella aerogenes]MEC5620666.1 hypothetical protein [Klebsiella aerogenes]
MDAKQIAQGIVDGLASIPESLYLTVVRTIEGAGIVERQYKRRNEIENERFFRVLKSLSSNEAPIRQLVTIVISDFYNKLDDNTKKLINDRLSYADSKLGSRIGAQAFITQYLAEGIISRLRMSKLMRRVTRVASAVTLNIIMVQGLIEEAARASRRFRTHYAETYFKVSPMNLDMVYFLVEADLEPYLLFINSHPVQCKGIEHEICKILTR